MSKASQGAPTKRPEPQRDLAEDVPVEVRRLEDDVAEGIVRDVREYDAQTRVVVATVDGDIANVAAEQLDVLTGAYATRVRQQMEERHV